MEKKKEKAKKKSGLFEIFENSLFKNIFLGVLIVILGFLVQFFFNKPNFGAYLSSDMDETGNVYVLGVDADNDQYKVTKVNTRGSVAYQINLEKSNKSIEVSYSHLEVDTKGNFYFLKTQKDLTAVSIDKSQLPIKNEIVLMYDTNGKYIKQVASVDLSKEVNPLTVNYIRKIQLVEQQMTIIACKNSIYDIITVNPLIDESPKKEKSFEVLKDDRITDTDAEIAADFAVLSNGRVIYSTKNGDLLAMDNQGNFVNYTTAISNIDISIYGLSVDNNDNIYMTDGLTGNFYKMNTKSTASQKLYDIDSAVANNGKIKIRDLRRIKVIKDGEFYASSKDFRNMYFVRFGNSTTTLSDLRGNFFPWGVLIFALTCAVALGLIFGIKYISRLEFARVSLSTKILAWFLPIYAVAMIVVLGVNTYDGANSYISVLNGEQDRGAKVLAENIDGAAFAKLKHTTDYMTPDYIKLKNQINKGYYDLTLKIGDKSDYCVTYIYTNSKLYATIDTKYSAESGSFDKLKYTDPDLYSSQCILVDCLLESDENETIYKVWEDFSNRKGDEVVEETFRDVYGDLSASFVAIKDTSGRAVGMVGNFLDVTIHRNKEFLSIFQRSLALVSIVTFLIFAYIWFVVYRALRPLKRIKIGIDAISRGEWQTKLVVSSKDELADIARAFNLMSEKIERYTKNLIRLNDEYVRYVPSEIFKFIDKQKITQVNLHDHKITNMNIVYITFNLTKKDASVLGSENEIFEMLNNSFEEFFKVVETNNGVVQSFDGLDMVILFPNSPDDALKAAVQFKESSISKVVKDNMITTVGSGEVLIGVSGNEKRRGVVVVSDEIMEMFNIDTQINTIGIKQAATKSVINRMTEEKICEYRFIGNVSNLMGERFTPIYQIFDSSNKYKRDLYLSTKEVFEKAVKLFISQDLEEARKMFTSVIRTNENDKVAMFYLMRCEEFLNKTNKKPFNGTLI